MGGNSGSARGSNVSTVVYCVYILFGGVRFFLVLVGRLLSLLGQFFKCASFHPLRTRVVRHALRGRSSLILVPANNNGSVYFRLPTVCVPKATVMMSPLVTLVGSRIRKLVTGNVPTTALGDVVPRRRHRQMQRLYVRKGIGLLCVSPRKVVDRLR